MIWEGAILDPYYTEWKAKPVWVKAFNHITLFKISLDEMGCRKSILLACPRWFI